MERNVRDAAIIFGLVAVYLLGTASLALTVDRGFFINDGVAIAVLLVFGLGLLVGERTSRR